VIGGHQRPALLHRRRRNRPLHQAAKWVGRSQPALSKCIRSLKPSCAPACSTVRARDPADRGGRRPAGARASPGAGYPGHRPRHRRLGRRACPLRQRHHCGGMAAARSVPATLFAVTRPDLRGHHRPRQAFCARRFQPLSAKRPPGKDRIVWYEARLAIVMVRKGAL
jgi:hypothetical protein